jgi:hypothetical protein
LARQTAPPRRAAASRLRMCLKRARVWGVAGVRPSHHIASLGVACGAVATLQCTGLQHPSHSNTNNPHTCGRSPARMQAAAAANMRHRGED